ncbi:hypothetical protein WMY93_019375 [Mugilogobius chulae]|uniref:Oxysterol-binding protein n=1 Tax=Mugilogobius chulae TaxID=88201 RepID=A0AAW0NIM1_9GOBI
MRSSVVQVKPLTSQQGSRLSGLEELSPSEEVTDSEDNEEEDLGVLDDQRSIILHLLSQLKLGMDLTRVVLPTFILEKRSLLEMYANFMAHPDMFLSITSGTTAEERIVRFVEYYLTAFHEGRKGAVAKKPYNPILGETFHCSWDVPREKVRTGNRTNNPGSTQGPGRSPNNAQGEEGGAPYRVRFVAEQVCHHPPVSGFYCECRERRMCVNAHVWTKSKFMGMSIGVSMVGEGVLYLLDHDEEYVFTLPSAYARSILTVPWVELGGKVSISCAKSGYSATVTFHTKPFYGGKVHRVTAEVKHNPTSTIVCKAQGEWNGTLEFTYSSGETKVIDTNKLPVTKKKLRHVEQQSRTESRRLWQHVTKSLKEGNIEEATEHKHRLEERQRSEEKQRNASNKPGRPNTSPKRVKAGSTTLLCGSRPDGGALSSSHGLKHKLLLQRSEVSLDDLWREPDRPQFVVEKRREAFSRSILISAPQLSITPTSRGESQSETAQWAGLRLRKFFWIEEKLKVPKESYYKPLDELRGTVFIHTELKTIIEVTESRVFLFFTFAKAFFAHATSPLVFYNVITAFLVHRAASE